MSEPTLRDILHILRNPHGWSPDAIRAAQLAACDLLESAAAPVPAREWVPPDDLLVTLRHARVFITSREKMHPAGVELYDRLIAKLEGGATLLREPLRGSPDVSRDADGHPIPYRPNKPSAT